MVLKIDVEVKTIHNSHTKDTGYVSRFTGLKSFLCLWCGKREAGNERWR